MPKPKRRRLDGRVAAAGSGTLSIPWENPEASRKSSVFWETTNAIAELLERSSTLNIGVDVSLPFPSALPPQSQS